jgi:alpha-ketoglutarate-dependent taurine dioxygenase
MPLTRESLISGQRAPLIITRLEGSQPLSEFVAEHRLRLRHQLVQYGAILFRRFGVRDAGAFSEFVAATGDARIEYRFGSTPRSLVKERIYTSTEYPANLEIALHSENSYHTVWPRKVAFCCVVPATAGGETPIADLREVGRDVGEALMDRLEEGGVEYVRHYHPGIDLPWETVFGTRDRSRVAEFCDARQIDHAWLGRHAELLRTSEICQGVVYHPVTGERLFFNQAHLFHETGLGEELAGSLRAAFGSQLPRHSRYGDGAEFEGDEIARIMQAFKRNARSFPWEAGDVLWVDNEQIAHGRAPFKGERRILAALMDSSDQPRPAVPRRHVAAEELT